MRDYLQHFCRIAKGGGSAALVFAPSKAEKVAAYNARQLNKSSSSWHNALNAHDLGVVSLFSSDAG